jgi:hypothetical protein
MLNPNALFRKTEAGVAEVSARKAGLRAELRRLLIMVDGRNTAARLATLVSNTETESLLFELQSLGLIDAADGTVISNPNAVVETVTRDASSVNTAASADAPVYSAEPTAEQFIAARRAAVRKLNEILGPQAESLALQIERCKTARELRERVTIVRHTLAQMKSEAIAINFLEAVREAAKPQP